MEGSPNGNEADGSDPGADANSAPGGTHFINTGTEAGFGTQKGTGPGGINEGVGSDTRKTCREQGLVCVHVRGGNVDHWVGVKDYLLRSVGLSLQEEGLLARHVGGYLKPGRDGARSGFGHRVFFPRTQVDQMQEAKAKLDISAEMKQNRESWSASYGANTIGGASTVYFDEDFIMGSTDKVLHSHIWGLEGVLSGHIYSQGCRLTKIFLDVYMAGVGDNEEEPAVQIVRTKVGFREGRQRAEDIWGWGLEVTDDEEGRLVADRVKDFDWTMVQSAMVDSCIDGPQHKMDMEGVGPVSALGYKATLAEWEAKREAAKTQMEKGVDDQEVVARTIMAWQMPANMPSQATWLQWIKELVQQDCESSSGERTYVGDEIVEASLQPAMRAPHQNYGKILCRDGAVGERLFWLQSRFREKWGAGVTLRESRTLSARKGEQAAKAQAAAARAGVGAGNGGGGGVGRHGR